MKLTNDQLKLAANTIRCLAADMVEQAKSGHPGVALGLADVATSLWLKFLDFDPKDVAWPASSFRAGTARRSSTRSSISPARAT